MLPVVFRFTCSIDPVEDRANSSGPEHSVRNCIQVHGWRDLTVAHARGSRRTINFFLYLLRCHRCNESDDRDCSLGGKILL